jgi:eukaryotic-like serine/threonine-protein kinase
MLCSECGQQFSQRGYRFCPYDGTRLEPEARSRSKPKTKDSVVEEGSMLGSRYTIRRYLSRGGMARVYLADDEKSGQLVAVKILDRTRTGDREVRERFLRDAQAASLVDHPGIVKIFDTGETSDGSPFLVMELLRGETLGELLQVEKTLDPALALSLAHRAAEALFAAHDQGIVHRDIKPDNIYLVGDPKAPEMVKILDFGFSRLYASKLTQAGTVIGTPGYMAPEQVVADPVDQRTDVYALGMVLYRTLAGQSPYKGDDIQVIAQQLLRPLPSPGIYKAIDKRIERIIATAAAKRPEHRYPSMKLFGEDCRRVLQGQSPIWAEQVARDRQGDAAYPLTGPVALQVAATYKRVLAKVK